MGATGVMGQRMRGRARAAGTYAFVPRQVGDVFELARVLDFDPTWMEVVAPDTPLSGSS